MVGYSAKILRINLTERIIKTEQLKADVVGKFLGGRGLGARMFSQEVPPHVEALSPQNKIFLATGLLTGSEIPASSRYMVVTKSPLNNTIASSNSGGYWGVELKFAGYDLVVLEGKAVSPVYITINNNQVKIRDAGHIWGKTVGDATDVMLAEFGDSQAKVLAIGPAGEKCSLIASVMNDRFRAAGRSGVGAVFGSKNVKGIVVRGTEKVKGSSPDALQGVLDGVLSKIQNNGVTGEGLPTYGTAVLVNLINETGTLPVKNFQESYAEKADLISGETLAELYDLKKDPCYDCPIACSHKCRVDGQEVAGPEYETIGAFGANCGVIDLKPIITANYLCNEFGLDTISVGATIATAIELYQRGYIKAEELDGTPLEFGNGAALVEWVRKIGTSEGLGAKMAMGSYRFAQCYSAESYSMHVKKQELPAYDPRGIQGHGLQYATSNRGGCHVRGYMISPEILGIHGRLDRFKLEGKAAWVKMIQDFTAVIDSLGLCLFTSFALNFDDYLNLVNAVTGADYTGEELLLCGERVWNVERLHNLQEGYSKADDTLPRRLLEDPIPNGPSKGWVHQLDRLLPEYYQVRGWDSEGVPTPECIFRLGI
ncbi:MAG: aldehyde ferredoxin oxidoreductase family protein [Desulfitobacteriaceae bacterium]|nr:aldehyde ferredoxin oxidoreductase family protein [Desulfitobacteriaceae bacterium]